MQVLNGQVGKRLGPLRGTQRFLATGAILAAFALVAVGQAPLLASIPSLPWWMFLPGVLNVAIIAAMIVVVNRAGALVTTSTIFFGNLVTGAVGDHLGLAGLQEIPASPQRLLSLAVFVPAIGLLNGLRLPRRSTSASNRRPAAFNLAATLLPALMAGAGQAVSYGINVAVAAEVGTLGSALMFLAPGAAILGLWFMLAARREQPAPGQVADREAAAPRRWSEIVASCLTLLPGTLNLVVTAGAILLVPHVGLQVYTSVAFMAAVTAGGILDRFGLLGLERRRLDRERLAAMALLGVGVILLLV